MTETLDKKAIPNPRPNKGADPIDLLVFLIPCLKFVKISLVGVLSGSDILLLAIFLYLVFRWRIQFSTPASKKFIVLCSLWLASQCVTDVIRRSAFVDYARGWSNIGMTLVNFAALFTLLYGRPKRLVLYGWGLVFGRVLEYFANPSDVSIAYPWKFGFAFPVTWAVFLIASRKECRNSWSIALSVIIGLINILAETRSLGLICLAAAFYLLVTGFLRRNRTGRLKLRAGTVMLVAALVILGAGGVFWAYQYAVGSGMLGEEARAKYESQSSGKYGLLLGGRTEMLGYLPAIYDSPILGHGSWARDPAYLLEERQALALLGYTFADEVSPEQAEEGYIPAHSYIFGSWVWAGVLGAVFWSWVWVLTVRILMRVYPANIALLPFMAFASFEMLWDLLFSPYGAEWRIIVPFYIVLLMTCSDMAPRDGVLVKIGVAKQRLAHAGG